jgi:hypothetical protein
MTSRNLDEGTPLTIVTIVKEDSMGLSVTAKSIEMQSMRPAWLVVCPNTENQTSILAYQKFKDGVVTRVEHDSGGGIYSAMNYAISLVSENQWILFLNAGDTFLNENVCEQILRSLNGFQGNWAFGGHVKANAHGEILGSSIPNSPFNITQQLFAKNFVSHQAFICKVEELRAIGGFDERYKVAADWDLMVRVALRSEGRVLPNLICVFRLGGFSTKMRHRSNIELLGLRFKYLPKSMQFLSLAWFMARLVRNQVLIVAESMSPRFLNIMRKRKYRSKQT